MGSTVAVEDPTPGSTAPQTAPRAISDLIASRLSVGSDTPIARVVKLFETHADVDAIAVLEAGRARLVCRSRFFLQLGRRFGYSLYENRPIGLLAEEGSTVDADADPLEVITLATQRDSGRVYDDILVLRDGRFLGTVSMRSLLVHHKHLLATSMAELALLDERNRRLEELSRIQSEFVANMTHELRSPLNTMLGIASLLLGDDALPEAHRRQLFLLVARGQELLGVVSNILDLARLESGAASPLPEEVDVGAVLEEVAESAEHLLPGKLVNLKIAFRALPRTFVTDPVSLRRIVTNLLSNAVKFTDAGTVTLSAEGQGRWLLLRVSDTGIGIREEDLPRLFKKFSQLESTKTKRHKGSGLGLAIVKALVDQLGGTVDVESRVGAGTTFTVRLPSADLPLPPTEWRTR
jgi:signal transduction histidine kinase